MLPDQRDAGHLWSMLKPAQYLVRRSESLSLDRLEEDEEIQYAVAKAFQLLGEGARRVSESFRAAHPEIPWSGITGMRNILVHEYEKVDWPIIWDTMRQSIPLLLTQLQSLLSDLSDEPESELH